jgi:DNA-binding NarL/FixJ family response regulator
MPSVVRAKDARWVEPEKLIGYRQELEVRGVLLWVAQGKANADIGSILGCAENTIEVHLPRIFEKLGTENRNAAALKAIEVLSWRP